jgi:hypothetical protein
MPAVSDGSLVVLRRRSWGRTGKWWTAKCSLRDHGLVLRSRA